MPNPARIRRYVVRFGLMIAVIGLVYLWRTYGTLRVPRGMDTMPSVPAGSTCIVQKRPSRVLVDSVVFVDLQDGSTVLARVSEVDPDGTLRITVDNPDSRFRVLSRAVYRVDQVRGLVLATFAPDAPVGEGAASGG